MRVDSGGAIALDGTSHCGLLETQGAENDWTFTVAAPGTQAWFDMPDPEGCACRQWSLRDSKNHYAVAATTSRYVGHVFLAPQTYTLTVTTLSPGRPSNLYYTFKAWSEPAANPFTVTAPFTVTGSADPTQSTITQGAGTPQVNSGAGNLEQPGAVDIYNITIPAGGAARRPAGNVGSQWPAQHRVARHGDSDETTRRCRPKIRRRARNAVGAGRVSAHDRKLYAGDVPLRRRRARTRSSSSY